MILIWLEVIKIHTQKKQQRYIDGRYNFRDCCLLGLRLANLCYGENYDADGSVHRMPVIYTEEIKNLIFWGLIYVPLHPLDFKPAP